MQQCLAEKAQQAARRAEAERFLAGCEEDLEKMVVARG